MGPAILNLVSYNRPDTRFVAVDIGMGFHVELSLEEALMFIPDKISLQKT